MAQQNKASARKHSCPTPEDVLKGADVMGVTVKENNVIQ